MVECIDVKEKFFLERVIILAAANKIGNFRPQKCKPSRKITWRQIYIFSCNRRLESAFVASDNHRKRPGPSENQACAFADLDLFAKLVMISSASAKSAWSARYAS